MRRDTFRRMKNYAVYYGAKPDPGLSNYDLVILEPSARHAVSGPLRLAYVSVMETGDHQELWRKVLPRDFLRVQGQPLRQPAYQTYVTDLTSAHWRGLLLTHIGKLLTFEGYDGIFLDTIGNVEMSEIPKPEEQVAAAIQFVSSLRSAFPEHILVMNNGLNTLVHRLDGVLDGVVWENPPLTEKSAFPWVQRITEKLEQLSLKTLLLFDGVERFDREAWLLRNAFASEHGFTAYYAPSHYVGNVNTWKSFV